MPSRSAWTPWPGAAWSTRPAAWPISGRAGSGSFTRSRSWRTRRASYARPASPRGSAAGSAPRPDVWPSAPPSSTSSRPCRPSDSARSSSSPVGAAPRRRAPGGRATRRCGVSSAVMVAPAPERGASWRPPSAREPPPELGRDTRLAICLLALAEGGSSADTWSARLALAPALREAIRRARSDAPGLLARLARTRGRSGAYAILQGVPEVTLAWARVRHGPRGRSATSGRLPAALAPTRRCWRRATTSWPSAFPAGPAVGELLRRSARRRWPGRSEVVLVRYAGSRASRPGTTGVRESSLTRPGRGGG